MFIIVLAISITSLLSFSDKIIEYFWPDNELNNISDDLHDGIIHLDDHKTKKI